MLQVVQTHAAQTDTQTVSACKLVKMSFFTSSTTENQHNLHRRYAMCTEMVLQQIILSLQTETVTLKIDLSVQALPHNTGITRGTQHVKIYHLTLLVVWLC